VGFEFNQVLLLAPEVGLHLIELRTGHHVVDLRGGVARVEHAHLVGQRAVHHFAVRAFDKAVLVDTGKAGERRDQADVRTFRRFDRADAAVVCGVYVADFKAGALA